MVIVAGSAGCGYVILHRAYGARVSLWRAGRVTREGRRLGLAHHQLFASIASILSRLYGLLYPCLGWQYIRPRNIKGGIEQYDPERPGVNQLVRSDSWGGPVYGHFQAPGVPGVEPNIRKDISSRQWTLEYMCREGCTYQVCSRAAYPPRRVEAPVASPKPSKRPVCRGSPGCTRISAASSPGTPPRGGARPLRRCPARRSLWRGLPSPTRRSPC